MNQYIIFFISLIVHEIGHISYEFVLTRKLPKIGFNFLMFYVNNDTSINTVFHQIMSILFGIVSGLIVLTVFNVGREIILFYLLACYIDLATITGLLSVMGDNKNIKFNTLVKDIPCPRCLELEKGK